MQRPKRSTRGQKPQRTAQQLAQDQKLYNTLFGAQALDEHEAADAEQQRKQLIRQQRRNNLKSNLENYAYVRAFHYFYKLDQIPRLAGHPSYAQYQKGQFSWTYSQDSKLYSNQALRQIINRKYFGLPRSSGQVKKEQDDSSWNQTFQLQERRYSIDRIIYCCKIILKKLSLLVKTGKIKGFRNIVKRDSQFELLWEESVSQQEKKELLTRKIIQFQRKRELRVKVVNDQEHKLLVQSLQKSEPGVNLVSMQQEGSIPVKKIKLV